MDGVDGVDDVGPGEHGRLQRGVLNEFGENISYAAFVLLVGGVGFSGGG